VGSFWPHVAPSIQLQRNVSKVLLSEQAVTAPRAMTIAAVRRFICLTLFVWGSRYATAADERFIDAHGSAIEALLKESLDGSNAGMVIGLLDSTGTRVFSAGKLDDGTEAKVDGDTVFEIGSCTKVFTTLLACEMARRGEVNLEDPVAKHLPPEVKVPAFEGKQITLRHLAAQESGLPWHADSHQRIFQHSSGRAALEELRKAADAYTAEDLYEFLAGHTLSRAPGSQFQYSNVGMALLGRALELRMGETYETLVVNRICRPLKMNDTRITLTPDQKTRLARGHWADGTLAENINFQVMAPAGSLLSTTNDLLKFLSATLALTDSDLRPAMEEMQVVRHVDAPKFGTTAMPWWDLGVYQPPGSQLLGHGGGGFGYLAFIGFDRLKRRGVVALTNQLAVNPEGIVWTLLQGLPLSRENVTYLVREIVGVGVALDEDKATGTLRITSVYLKSPAGLAGLSAGLRIEKINGVSVQGKSLQDCLGMMKGSVGTKVSFDVVNPETKENKTVELTRQKFVTTTG
jgi:CubicO group peptidase (beta-lactamase class C family)